MTNSGAARRRYNIIAIVCGFVTALLGLIVMLGWHMDVPSLKQINPSFAPMQYNTAVCFLLGGISLVARARSVVRLSRMLGGFIILLCGLTLAQYVCERDFGIDQLLMKETVMTKTSHPGRMAPNTSLCFLLVGAVLAMGRQHISARLGFAFSALVLAVLALAGYASYSEEMYGWGNLTRMALHTAGGMLLLTIGIIAVVFQRRKNRMDVWSFLPVSLAAVIAIMSFFAWYSAVESADARNRTYFDTLTQDVHDALKDRFNLYEQSLRAGLGLFYASEVVERDEWASFVDALEISTHLPGISGVGYIDYILAQDMGQYVEWTRRDGVPDFNVHPDTLHPDKFVIRLIEPIENNKEALGLDIGFEAHRREAAERARDMGVPVLTKRIELVQDKKKRKGFLLLLPFYDHGGVPQTLEHRRENFRGWVYAPFIGENFLRGLTFFGNDEVDFRVYDGDTVNEDVLIYEGNTPPNNYSHQYKKESRVRIAGRDWTLEWWATDNFTPPVDHNAGLYVLAVGLLISFFVYLILSQLLRRKEIVSAEVKQQTAVIHEQSEQREKLLGQLTRSNEDLERFAYIASHDLQEPLRMVRSFTGLLEEQYADKLDETAQKYIGFAHSSAGRMQDLINDLLEYSRIGSESARYENIHLDDIYEDVLENLEERISVVDAEVTSDDLPQIKGNPVRMTRLLQNLIGNGLKYQEEGVKPKVHVSAKKEENAWLISITDNGIGIDAKYAMKIFEPFERLHGKDEYSGTGMGLAICKKIVEDFGGTIWVEADKSKVKKGTVVYFTIPENNTQ